MCGVEKSVDLDELSVLETTGLPVTGGLPI